MKIDRIYRIVQDFVNNENQPRRNEEHEDFFCFSFVLFVSSWLIFRKRFEKWRV